MRECVQTQITETIRGEVGTVGTRPEEIDRAATAATDAVFSKDLLHQIADLRSREILILDHQTDIGATLEYRCPCTDRCPGNLLLATK